MVLFSLKLKIRHRKASGYGAEVKLKSNGAGEIEENTVPANTKIIRIEFSPSIFPRQIELGKMYVGKNEIIEQIVESDMMIHIYTPTCGIKYGTPISIYKKDIKKVIYK